MHQDEIPKRAPGHREASASITAAFATLPYPVSKQEALGRLADWKVPLHGERVPLGPMLEAIPTDDFRDSTEAIKLIDQHWGRMVENLQGSSD